MSYKKKKKFINEFEICALRRLDPSPAPSLDNYYIIMTTTRVIRAKKLCGNVLQFRKAHVQMCERGLLSLGFTRTLSTTASDCVDNNKKKKKQFQPTPRHKTRSFESEIISVAPKYMPRIIVIYTHVFGYT